MKIPLTLVTGFLGSGKTTFLRRLAADNPHLRMLFLVNEFAETSVDAASLADAGSPVQSVVGGSLFCECKAAEFVRVMQETVLQEHQKEPFHSVVIETSGIADPEAIGRIMSDFKLDKEFEVKRVISITAPRSFLKLIDNLPNIAAQIRTSNLVVLNKADLSSETELAEVERRVQEENPGVETVRCAYCQFPFTWTTTWSGVLPDAPLAAKCNPYTTVTVRPDRIVSADKLEEWLEAIPESILRVKGCVQTDTGWLRIERSVEGLELDTGQPSDDPLLVLIAQDDDAALLPGLVEAFPAITKGGGGVY